MASGKISNSAITSSSYKSAGHESYRGRLSKSPTPSETAWCASATDSAPFLRIDLGGVKIVNELGTDSFGLSTGKVKTFYVSFSENGKSWKMYQVNGNKKACTLPLLLLLLLSILNYY